MFFIFLLLVSNGIDPLTDITKEAAHCAHIK